MIIVTVNWGSMAADKQQRFFTTLSCRRCAGPVLIEHDAPQSGVDRVVRVIPSDRETALGVRNLPPDVERYYRGAITVLEAGVPDAAAVQLRKTLEAAAEHFEVKPSPLVRAIRHLMEKGLITTQFGDVLGHIRIVGNIGAHATDKQVDRATAERALRFTTQVLRNLFEIPAELAELGEAPPADDGSEEQAT